MNDLALALQTILKSVVAVEGELPYLKTGYAIPRPRQPFTC